VGATLLILVHMGLMGGASQPADPDPARRAD
jgi:hypothetical protein